MTSPPSSASEPSAADLLTEQVKYSFEVIPDAVAVVSRDWRFLYGNRLALYLVNTPSIVGRDIFELFPGNRQEPFYGAYQATMLQRITSEFEAFHPAPLNLWLKVQSRPFGDGIIIFFSDVTARRQAEQREQEMATRLSQVLEATSDAIAALDREWRYSYLNGPAQRLIDPENRLIGKNIWEEFPAAIGTPAWGIYHRAMDEGKPGSTEIYYPEPINAWLSLQAQPAREGIVVFFRDITEQKMHDQLVREQQELLADVQSAVLLATWDIDLATGTVRYGAGSYPVYGHPLEDICTRDAFHNIVHPDFRESLAAAVEQSMKSGERFVHDLQVIAANGELLWVESRWKAVLNEKGVATHLRGMGIDISARKRSEASLLASEERYRVLADLNPQAIWMGDADGNIMYANQGFLAYIGLAPESLTGLGWLEAFDPDDRARVAKVWTRSVTTGVDYDIEARLCKKATGELRYWHLRAAPIRDNAGTILHWLGVANDIHDMKMHAADLRAQQMETERQREELETVYKTTPVGLALFDPVEFRFLNLNDSEAEMLGYTREYVLGRPLSEIAPIPGLEDMFRGVAEGNVIKDHVLEGEVPGRPNERRVWNVNFSPIFNRDGTVRAIASAAVEITKQKKAESALIQSEKLAAVGRLASSISHEINNPLEAITNLLYLIAHDEQLPPGLKTYVSMAQAELSRVSQIATQTLRFHRQAVAPTLVTAEELVGAVIRLYTGRLANSNIKVDASYAAKTKILCFENDIRQVLNNLIANAIDAMRTGGRLVVRAHEIRAGVLTDNPPGVRITIADTGHGMSAKTLQRLFEPFFTTKDLNGTGLGLWISQGIVDRHQGRLRVRSSDDPARHGSVFTLFLPCEEVTTL